MLLSMTGFGMAKFENEDYQITVDIRSINSKFMDLNVRLPKTFNDKEPEIKLIISKNLERGKINVNIDFVRKKITSTKASINTELVKAYYADLKNMAQQVGDTSADLLKMALQMPEAIVYDSASENIENEWKLLEKTILEATNKCIEFRKNEGDPSAKEIGSYINKIDELAKLVEGEAPKRIEDIKNRIKNGLSDFFSDKEHDANRFEQELIFYIEKLDISEELIRLKSHLEYFINTIKTENNNGKKLGFIAQEIGREINTIGSKANNASIQRHVINMKDELEKIKEQLMNVV
jgi:uncharacterized protein (TIGR00255 family)